MIVWPVRINNTGLRKGQAPCEQSFESNGGIPPIVYGKKYQCRALIFFEKSELRMGSCEQDYSWSVLFARPHEKHIGGKLGPQKQHRCFCEVTRESSDWLSVSDVCVQQTLEVVQQQDWAMSTYGPLRCLARDLHGEKLWLCSERHAFGLHIEKEDRHSQAISG